MFEMGLWLLGVLAMVAFAAGFVDSIAGGGGLLTLPALLSAGLDPVTALATNKLQGTFGSLSAMAAFGRARKIDWRATLPMAAVAFVASLAGAGLVAVVPVRWLAGVMPLLLIGVALYFALPRKSLAQGGKPRISARLFKWTVAPGIGLYDGFFGPGTGSFLMICFTSLLGQPVLHATAHTKLLNFASNVGSSLLFAISGSINLPIGICMAVGQYAGAQLGSRVALRSGARLIRPMLVIVCLAMALRLLADPANPLRHAIMGY